MLSDPQAHSNERSADRGNPTPSGVLSSRRYWTEALRWLLVVLIVLELFTRIFVIRPPQAVYLPEWGIVPAEGASSFQGLEGSAVTHYLAYGEVATPVDDPDAISIVVLGDSTVQAAQVANDENFVSLTETALRADGRRVDLHNLGRALQSMADCVYIAPAVNARFSPQIVVVQVNASTFDNSYVVDRDNQFLYDAGGKLTLSHRAPSDVDTLGMRNLLNRSALYAFLDFRMTALPQVIFVPAKSDRFNPAIDRLEQDSSGQVKTVRRSARERSLSQVALLEKAYPNSKIVLIVIPYVPTVSMQDGVKVSWNSENDDHLFEILSGAPQIRVLSARNAFRDLYKKHNVFPRGMFINSEFNFGHLNEAGHSAVAELLTAALEHTLP